MINSGVTLSPQLERALKVISARLHPLLDQIYEPGLSKTSCIGSSLVVRDFLRAADFAADVLPVKLGVWATDENGAEVDSLGIGMMETDKPGWNCHMVVLVKDEKTLVVDPTIGQARRPAWPGLPEMVVAAVIAPSDRHRFAVRGHEPLAGFSRQDHGRDLHVMWVAAPNLQWRDTCPSRKSYPRIAMMQSGQDWCGDDGPRSLYGSS
jgi:hypothetical protein